MIFDTIKSNGHPRPRVTWHELSASQQESIDYLDESEKYDDRFFVYRGSAYDIDEFLVPSDRYKALGWDGVQGESYFSAVLVKWFDADGNYLDDKIVVGYVHW